MGVIDGPSGRVSLVVPDENQEWWMRNKHQLIEAIAESAPHRAIDRDSIDLGGQSVRLIRVPFDGAEPIFPLSHAQPDTSAIAAAYLRYYN
jgi:hypothetical protein